MTAYVISRHISRHTFRIYLHAFFISNTLISNTRLKLAKNQANAEQHPEAELLLFENYSHSSVMLSSKLSRTYSKKISKRINVSVFMRLYDHNENEDKNEK